MRTFPMLLLAATFTMACATEDDADHMATDAMPMDSMAGMDHSQMGMGEAHDGQHEFLQLMSNHHDGLVRLGEAAMYRASSPAAQQDAHMVHTKQAAERDTMVQHIQRLYQEQHQVQPMPKTVAQADSLAQLSGEAYDRMFYRLVVEHHREGMQLIDQHLPHLTDPQVKQLAEKMKAEQQNEIAEYERKAGGGTGR